MKTRAHEKRRVHLGVMMLAMILSVLGAQQLILEPADTRLLVKGVSFASTTP
jgi:hypothetical protein